MIYVHSHCYTYSIAIIGTSLPLSYSGEFGSLQYEGGGI